MLEWIVYITNGKVYVDKQAAGEKYLDRFEISKHGIDSEEARLSAYKLASRAGLPIAPMIIDPDVV